MAVVGVNTSSIQVHSVAQSDGSAATLSL